MAVTKIMGTNTGNDGTTALAAGDGVVLLPKVQAKLVLNASVTGGSGYSYGHSGYPTGNGGNGGAGIYFISDGGLNSFGTITGGAGGTSAQGPTSLNNEGGNGGAGLLFANSHNVKLLNHGAIEGGAGGYGGINFANINGDGGAGVALDSGGVAINSGVITGGASNGPNPNPPYFNSLGPDGGNGGDGGFFGADGTLKNHGTVIGGVGGYGGNASTAGLGGSGVAMTQIGTVTNTRNSEITGGEGGQGYGHGGEAGAGGAGIVLDAGGLSGLVVNDAGATITGGQGGAASDTVTYSPLYTGGAGGDGVDATAGGNVLNHGTIIGGQGGLPDPNLGANPVNLSAVGGVGVNLGGGVLHNSGTISGGYGGGNGGPGGIGLISSGGGNTASNSGLITGGQGQEGLARLPVIGGDGVLMTGSGTFINNGVVAGGGNAAAGMAFDAGNNTLINNGTIDSGSGAFGTAVHFGGGSNLLVIDAAATFIGGVAAAGSNNVLELTGTAAGTLDNPQNAFQGFDTLQVDAGSTWSLSGSATNLLNNGTIDIQGGDSLAISTVDPNSAGVFQLTGMASLTIGTLLGTNTQIEFTQGPFGSSLNLSNPSSFGIGSGDFYAGPLLENFGQGDQIDLQGIGYAGDSTSYDNATGILQVENSASNVVASLHFQDSSLGFGLFQLTPDTSGGVVLTRGLV